MKFNLKKTFNRKYFICSGKDSYLIIDYLSVTFINKKTLEEEKRIIDYFNGVSGYVTRDKKYLLLGNISGEYRLYDIEKQEYINEIHPEQKDNMICIDLEEKLDSKSFFMTYSSSDFLYTRKPRKASDMKLFECTFPDFKGEKELSFDSKYYDVYACRMLNGYLLINNKGTIDFMDENNNITKHPEILYNDIQPVTNEERKEIYIVSEYGFRVYDSNLVEINKFDVINDNKKEITSPLYYFLNKGTLPDKEDNTPQMENAEQICGLEQLDENHVVALVTEAMSAYSKIDVIDVRDGSLVGELKLGFKVDGCTVLDSTHIAFSALENIHILEIES